MKDTIITVLCTTLSICGGMFINKAILQHRLEKEKSKIKIDPELENYDNDLWRLTCIDTDMDNTSIFKVYELCKEASNIFIKYVDVNDIRKAKYSKEIAAVQLLMESIDRRFRIRTKYFGEIDESGIFTLTQLSYTAIIKALDDKEMIARLLEGFKHEYDFVHNNMNIGLEDGRERKLKIKLVMKELTDRLEVINNGKIF